MDEGNLRGVLRSYLQVKCFLRRKEGERILTVERYVPLFILKQSDVHIRRSKIVE